MNRKESCATCCFGCDNQLQSSRLDDFLRFCEIWWYSMTVCGFAERHQRYSDWLKLKPESRKPMQWKISQTLKRTLVSMQEYISTLRGILALTGTGVDAPGAAGERALTADGHLRQGLSSGALGPPRSPWPICGTGKSLLVKTHFIKTIFTAATYLNGLWAHFKWFHQLVHSQLDLHTIHCENYACNCDDSLVSTVSQGEIDEGEFLPKIIHTKVRLSASGVQRILSKQSLYSNLQAQ